MSPHVAKFAGITYMERRRRPRPQRVLVVDDNADIRELWRIWLNFWGFAVQEAPNGAEGVQKARLSPPDLVLMDLWMPVLDGVEATKQLKEDARTAHVPVVALSAQTASPSAAEVTDAGAEAFLQKPCDPEELLRQIRSALTRLQGNRRVSARGGSAGAGYLNGQTGDEGGVTVAEHDPRGSGDDGEPKPSLRNWPPLHIVEKHADEEPAVHQESDFPVGVENGDAAKGRGEGW